MRLSEVTPEKLYLKNKTVFLARIFDRFSKKYPEQNRSERSLRAGNFLKEFSANR
jgi:hypothetical protein